MSRPEDAEFIERTREMFWLLNMVLPLSQAENKGYKFLNYSAVEIIPAIISACTQLAVKMPDEFGGYLVFVKEAIEFILGERDTFPETDEDPEDIKKFYLIQSNLWKTRTDDPVLDVKNGKITFVKKYD